MNPVRENFEKKKFIVSTPEPKKKVQCLNCGTTYPLNSTHRCKEKEGRNADSTTK
jgi:hypothetical protein